MRMWLVTALVVLLVLVVGIAGAIWFGASRWQRETASFRARLEDHQSPPPTKRYLEREIEGLPAPVRKYFRSVLHDGQAIIAVARFSQAGEFLLNEEKKSWGPFQATQMVTTRSPGFDWDARISWAPGVRVFVRDSYDGATGSLRAAAFGLLTVAEGHGTPEMAHGEMMRYLAEGTWYPTALLPSQGVMWESMDDSTARASLTNAGTTVSLEFRFDSQGLITGFYSPGRYQSVKGAYVLVPWQGQFRAYEMHAGIRIPGEGEVAWITPAGVSPYWRGRITEISYEFAR